MASSTKTKEKAVTTDPTQNPLVAPKTQLASGEVKSYLMELIKPDPDQPRKFVDQTELQELANSIQQIGLQQAIILRPDPKNKGHYIIVSGERRYLAVNKLEWKLIDARLLSDEELPYVKLIQLAENNQRVPVHILDEAEAVYSLLSDKITVKELAARMGKSEKSIYRMISLLNLPGNIAMHYRRGIINDELAVLLTSLPQSSLDTLDRKIKDQEVEEVARYIQDFIDNSIRSIALTDAIFPLDSQPKGSVGPCEGCVHNTASKDLFHTENTPKNSTCLNPACYKIKKNAEIKKRFDEIVADPKGCFVIFTNETDRLKNDPLILKAKELGKEVFVVRSWDNQYVPIPVLETFEQYYASKQLDLPLEVAKELYQEEAVAEYHKEMKAYEIAKARKDVFTCMYLGEREYGMLGCFIKSKGDSENKTKPSAKPKPSAIKALPPEKKKEFIKEETSKIKERASRMLELDGEKITAAILEKILSRNAYLSAVGKGANAPFKPDELHPIEMIALHEICSTHHTKTEIAKRTGLTDKKVEDLIDITNTTKPKVGNIPLTSLITILRLYIYHNIVERQAGRYNNPKDIPSRVQYVLSHMINAEATNKIVAAQNEIAKARIERTKKRLEDLKK